MMNMMGGMGGGVGAGGPPGAAGGGDAMSAEALEREVMAVLQQYVQGGGSLNPDEAPPEMRELLLAMQSGQLPIGQGAKGPKIPGPASAPPPEGEGEDIVPEPGFVMKTIDDNGRKVFLNICGSPKVGAPGDWSKGKMPPEVEKAISQAEEQGEDFTPVRFPLSCGEPRNDLDKQGTPCTVFDLVFNDEVAQQACGHRQLKDFLCNLGIQWVGQKHGLTLDERYKLPKMKYKGDHKRNVQRVRVDAKTLIEEVEEDPADAEPSFPLSTKPRPATVPLPPGGLKQARAEAAKLERAKAAPAPGGGGKGGGGGAGGGQVLHAKLDYESRPVDAVLLSVQLPPKAAGASGVGSMKVEVLGEMVRIAAPGCQQLDVALPFPVTNEGAQATVNAMGVLQMRLAYAPYGEVVEEMRAAAPFKFGELSLNSDSYLELEP